MVSRAVVILLVIIGAAVAVCLAWGVATLIDRRKFVKADREVDSEQARYMRELRIREQNRLAAVNGFRLPID